MDTKRSSVVSFKFSKKSEKRNLCQAGSVVQEESNKYYITELNKDDIKETVEKTKSTSTAHSFDQLRSKIENFSAGEPLADSDEVDTARNTQQRLPLINMTGIVYENADDNDYEGMPIEEFGKEMMRRMGWREGIPNVMVKIKENTRCLGLGEFNRDGKMKQKDAEDGEQLSLEKGAYCIFELGANKGQYGKVNDDDGTRLLVEMALTGAVVDTCSANVRVVSKKEFEKRSKYINSSKVEEYLRRQTEKHESKDEEHRGGDNKGQDKEREKVISGEQKRDSPPPGKKIKREGPSGDRKFSSSKTSESKKTENDRKRQQTSWLLPNLIVRVVDKKLKYFMEKIVIEDVTKPLVCNCRAPDGRFLENLRQDQLETVIPRKTQAVVMIVRGEQKFQVAKILLKDKEDSRVTVNIVGEYGDPMTLDFDDVCQFIDGSA